MKVKEAFSAFKFRVLTLQSHEAETPSGKWEKGMLGAVAKSLSGIF